MNDFYLLEMSVDNGRKHRILLKDRPTDEDVKILIFKYLLPELHTSCMVSWVRLKNAQELEISLYDGEDDWTDYCDLKWNISKIKLFEGSIKADAASLLTHECAPVRKIAKKYLKKKNK